MTKVPTLEVPDVELRPTPINPKTAATLGGEVVDLGEGLSALGEKVQKVLNVSAKNKALTTLSDSLNKIQDKYHTDPNLQDAYDRSNVDLDKAVETSASTIQDPEARNEFLTQATRIRDMKSTAINNMLMSRTLQEGRTNLKKLTVSYQSLYNNANTPDQENFIKDQFNKSVDEMIDANGVSPEVAERMRNDQNYHFGVAKALHDVDISNSPTLTKSVQDKLQKGDYGDLKEQDFRHIQNYAQSREKYLTSVFNQKQKIYQQRNYDDLASAWNNHALNAQQLEEAKYTNKISQAQYDKLEKASSLKIGPSGTTNKQTYNDLIKQLCDPEVDPDAKREALIDARIANDKKSGDGINEKDFNNLWSIHIMPTSRKGQFQSVGQQPGANKDIQEIQDAENKDNAVKKMQSGMFGWFQTFNKHYDTNTASKVMQDAHDRLAQKIAGKDQPDDSDVADACREANAAYVGTHFPDYKTYPKGGKLFMMSGTYFKIHPDGQCTLGKDNAS